MSSVSLVFYLIDMITKSVRFLYQFLTSGIHFLYRRVYIKFEIHLHGVKHFTLYINYDMIKFGTEGHMLRDCAFCVMGMVWGGGNLPS